MKKTILFINKAQFGYHTDYYKFCEYLRDIYEVKYFCFDTGKLKLNMERVSVKYVPFKGPKALRGLRFMLFAIISILNTKGLVFVSYFPGCLFLKKVFPWRRMLLDIRTLSITPNEKKRRNYDRNIIRTAQCYDFVTIISQGLREKIKLDLNKSAIIPLGSDSISLRDKDFSQLKLLYVGTLNWRNIIQTVEGLNLCLQKNPAISDISYDIIGDGKEYELLNDRIRHLKLDDRIILHGSIPHFKIQPYFDNCNVGVSYVPITDYYNYQPVTKTYEYLMSGMVCLGTNTIENRKIVDERNGILCEDNPESFANALLELYSRIKSYNSDLIRSTVEKYSWERIVEETLLPVLEEQFQN